MVIAHSTECCVYSVIEKFHLTGDRCVEDNHLILEGRALKSRQTGQEENKQEYCHPVVP